MAEVVYDLALIVGIGFWAFLIVIGLHPVWGAEFGMWLRSFGQNRRRETENDKIVQELLDLADQLDSPRSDAEPEHVGRNLDRFV